MDELIFMDGGDYKRYEELLIRRDRLLKEAESIHISYIQEFGELQLKDFELKVECIRIKKEISYCQQALNRGKVIDADEMRRVIEESMALYNMQLQELLAAKNAADTAKTSPAFKVERAKRCYRRLAKLIHPDIYPEVMENEELRDLWNRIVIAYKCNDDEELEDLETLVRMALQKEGVDLGEPNIENLAAKISKLEDEINDILTSEPYIWEDLLSDPDKVSTKKEELNKSIEEYTKYKEELQKILEDLLSEGGATLAWIKI